MIEQTVPLHSPPRQPSPARSGQARRPLITFGLVIVMLAAGCTVRPRSSVATTLPTSLPSLAGLDEPQYVESIDASCPTPLGWTPEPLKGSSRHTHQIWLSPTGNTAYGVIHFGLPFPVGHELVLWYFMKEMRRHEGEGVLEWKQWDPNRRALRFVASGGRYTIRCNLTLRGFAGWVVYAGTRRNQPIEQIELDLAERAREHTIFGRQPATTSASPAAHSGK